MPATQAGEVTWRYANVANGKPIPLQVLTDPAAGLLSAADLRSEADGVDVSVGPLFFDLGTICLCRTMASAIRSMAELRARSEEKRYTRRLCLI